MGADEPGRKDDDIVARGIERAVGGVGDPRLRQRDAGIEREVAELEDVVRTWGRS